MEIGHCKENQKKKTEREKEREIAKELNSFIYRYIYNDIYRYFGYTQLNVSISKSFEIFLFPKKKTIYTYIYVCIYMYICMRKNNNTMI